METSDIGMYVFINKELHMSAGKIAAQAVHAGIEAYRISDPKRIKLWYKYKFYPVFVLEAQNADHLKDIKSYLGERGIHSSLIIDEPLTELDKHTPTALGVELVDRNKVGEIFKTFKLYRDIVKVNLSYEK